ncbi:MAG: tol-pal system protein YbgF [Myxococcaceae bacterium]|nr:tol-pal system protein YbgF [Myxococcaceae bacterium]
MNGVWPIGRTASACGSALLTLVLASACAHGGQPAIEPSASVTAEHLRLQAQLAERDETIQQLEGRMALLEASERQLRERLETSTSLRLDDQKEAEARDAVRIGRVPEKPAAPEPAREPRPRLVLTSESTARPMLRLHAEGRESDRRELTSSSWTPPTATERLTVMQVPQLPSSSARPPSRSVESSAPMPSEDNRAPMPAPRALPSGPADELYLHALDLVRRREFPEALRELDAFLQGFPDDARNARAQFWRGEILYAQRDFTRALAAFEQSLGRDPRGDKAPDTLLRIARCHAQLGAHERAHTALHKLQTNFPDSEAARVARQVKQEDT